MRNDEPYNHGQEEKTPCFASHKSPKRKLVKPVSGNFQNPLTSFEKRNHKKSMERKNEERPKIAVSCTEKTVRTAVNKIFHRELLPTSSDLQRSSEKDLSPKKTLA